LKNLENDEERTSCCKSTMLRKNRKIRLLLCSTLLSLFSRLQLELTRTRTRTRWTRTRTRWTRGILSTWINNWNPSFDSVEEVCLQGLMTPCLYSPLKWMWAVGSNDLNHMVFLDPQRRWSTIRETCPEWSLGQGRRPRGDGGRPAPGPVRPPVRNRGFWSLLDDRKLAHTLISLCKPDMWAFSPYFLITPSEIDKHQNSWNCIR